LSDGKIVAIFQIIPAGNKLVVETTTEKLDQHLSRTIYKGNKGDLSFQWREPSKFVRVYWNR
jgi:hypothetical protein